MKNKINLLICLGISVFSLSVPLTAFAGTVGNTGGADTLRGTGIFSLKKTSNIPIETAIDADIIFARDLSAEGATNASIKESQWYMVRLGYRMFDRIEPYVRLGGAHLKAKWTDSASAQKIEMDTSSGFAWGLGLKALLFDIKNPRIKIIGDGSYRTTDLDPHKGYFNAEATGIDKNNSKFVIREWQVALLAATEMDLSAIKGRSETLKGYKLCPYAGVKYSDVSARIRMVASGATYYPNNIESDRKFGIVTGLDLTGDDNIAVNVEGRFIDETAVSAGVSALF
ncbi:MAG: hypothetical protein NTV07_00105 [Candidatus Omnitrophica bacterium]|nr:hypothetical protein [Candidatus Omnitrophota bacterium]